MSSPLRAAVRSDRSVWAAVAFFSCDAVFTAAAPPAVTRGTDRTWRERHMSRCPTLVIEQVLCLKDRQWLWSLTCGVAAAACAAQCRPLQVEAVLAALAVAALGVSLTVDTVQTPRVPQAVPRSPIAVATQRRCRGRQEVKVSFVLC